MPRQHWHATVVMAPRLQPFDLPIKDMQLAAEE
jgi:hypothetical protein